VSIAIIGGGVVSMEFAEFFSSIGSEVTVIEMMPELLPAMDRELGAAANRIMTQKGVTVYTGAKVTGIEKGKVTFERNGASGTVSSQDILVAIGRVPSLGSLKLENTNIKFSSSGIAVDGSLRTNVPNIYAIGDTIPTTQLAAVASDEGSVAVANITGKGKKMDYSRIPSCVFIEPQIASVGMSEEEAREKGVDYKVGKFPMAASGKAMVENVTEGFVKIIAAAGTEQVLGVHMVAPDATELVSLCSLAISMEATLEELIENYYPHPTVGEAIMEAALAARGKAVHF
jgi:dihydrolipoamide dehydrogenase